MGTSPQPAEKARRQLQAIAEVERQFEKRAAISVYALIPLFAYAILGGFVLSSHLAIFWPTLALDVIAIIALLVWSQLWRYAISTYSSLFAMLLTQVIIAGGGWTGVGFWAAGPNGDGQTYLGEHMWLIIILCIVVLLLAIGVSIVVYMKLEKYINTHWADKRLKDHLKPQFDKALSDLSSKNR
jgi:hypothetical protein